MTSTAHRTPLVRLSLALKALRQLGPAQLGLYALYQLGLRAGYYRRITRRPVSGRLALPLSLSPALILPSPQSITALLSPADLAALRLEADEIVSGQVRLFGGAPVLLALSLPGPLEHWTAYERTPPGEDIKFTWEPARFGWAFTLGRAYHLTQDERYPAAFWQFAETFLDANPPYLGPHWSSAQEVALRLLAFTFAAQVFAASPHATPARLERLAQAIAAHAERIPPTLV
jgi:hypothetical protein